MIVRSDGTVTYVGKDMAYQLWKFGLLGKDFHYRVFDRAAATPPLVDQRPTPASARRESPRVRAAPRGSATSSTRGSRTCRSCSSRRSRRSATSEQAAHSVHYSYEMVALSHATARELGYDTAVRRRSAVRRGVRTQGPWRQGRRPARPADRQGGRRSREAQHGAAGRGHAPIAEAIAIAAVRYFMVKFSRGKIIVFDIDEALSFEGESGPYLQYAVVRANNIFAKLQERDGLDERRRRVASLERTPADALTGARDEAHRPLGPGARGGAARRSRRAGGADAGAVGAGEVRVRPGAGVQRLLPQYSILNEERDDVRSWRAAAVAYYRAQLTRALELMGCAVPAKM